MSTNLNCRFIMKIEEGRISQKEKKTKQKRKGGSLMLALAMVTRAPVLDDEIRKKLMCFKYQVSLLEQCSTLLANIDLKSALCSCLQNFS
jgi:hypothetical protein